MYLSRLHIRQVRVFDDITLYFKNEIKILIGENNSGNTAIIDALRICIPLKRIYAPYPNLALKNSFFAIIDAAKYLFRVIVQAIIIG